MVDPLNVQFAKNNSMIFFKHFDWVAQLFLPVQKNIRLHKVVENKNRRGVGVTESIYAIYGPPTILMLILIFKIRV